MGRIAEVGKLTPREAMFLRLYIKGATLEEAYREVHEARLDAKPLSEKSIRQSGSRMLKRIEKKIDMPRLLNSAGLGITRFAAELEKRYNAKETHFYRGKVVCDVEDNSTRMRATELHARLLGLDKIEISGPGGGPIPVQIIDDIPAGQEPPK